MSPQAALLHGGWPSMWGQHLMRSVHRVLGDWGFEVSGVGWTVIRVEVREARGNRVCLCRKQSDVVDAEICFLTAFE